MPLCYQHLVHTTSEKFDDAALFLRLGLTSTLIRHENGTFRKRSSNSITFSLINYAAHCTFSSPEPTILLACGRNREALGATISGMRHRCRLRETGWAEFGYFLCYFKMIAPRALDSCRRPEGS